MSITKFSPEDVSLLAERLNRLENEIRALKMEKKAHYSAIIDGAFRIIDASDNERARLGKISTGVYGIKIYDDSGNVVQEITDSVVNAIKILGAGLNTDGDILFASLVLPAGRKALFITPPRGNHIDVTNGWITQYLGNGTYTHFDVLGTVLATNYQAIVAKGSSAAGHPAYPNLRNIWTAGTYSNIKLYARGVAWRSDTNHYYNEINKSPWVALEVEA